MMIYRQTEMSSGQFERPSRWTTDPAAQRGMMSLYPTPVVDASVGPIGGLL